MTRLYHVLYTVGKGMHSLGTSIAERIPGGWKGSRVIIILKEHNVWIKGEKWVNNWGMTATHGV